MSQKHKFRLAPSTEQALKNIIYKGEFHMRSKKFEKINFLKEVTIIANKTYIAKICMPVFGTFTITVECANDDEFISIINNFTNIPKGE